MIIGIRIGSDRGNSIKCPGAKSRQTDGAHPGLCLAQRLGRVGANLLLLARCAVVGKQRGRGSRRRRDGDGRSGRRRGGGRAPRARCRPVLPLVVVHGIAALELDQGEERPLVGFPGLHRFDIASRIATTTAGSGVAASVAAPFNAQGAAQTATVKKAESEYVSIANVAKGANIRSAASLTSEVLRAVV